MKRILFSFILFFHSYFLSSQKIDSLIGIFENKLLHDTVRCKAIGDASWELVFSQPDSSISLANIELKFALHKNLTRWIIDANNTIGYAHFLLGNFNTSIKYYSTCEKLSKKLHLFRSSAVAANNLGTVYYRKGDYLKAIKYFFSGLKDFDKLGDDLAMANSYNNIGTVYKDMRDFVRARNYYSQALKLFKKANYDRGVSMIMNNLGLVHNNLKEYKQAIPYFEKAISIRKKLNDRYGLANCYLNVGGGYFNAGNIDSAKFYYELCFKLLTELNDPVGLALLSSNYGELEIKNGNWQKAVDWCGRGLKLAERNNNPLAEVKANCSCLADAYAMGGKFKEAYKYHLQFIAARDSIDNKERNEAITRKEIEYSYEKKATADSVRNAEKEKVHKAEIMAHNAQLKQDKILTYSLIIGLSLVVVFAVFIFNRFKLSKKQNLIIQSQKEEVEVKNKEITDSILYAKRIQDALLPSEKYLEKNLNKTPKS